MITGSSTINYKIGNERLVKVTEAASRKLASLLEEKGKPNGALRLAVIGGGCSGLQYTMDLVEGPANRDILIPASNVRVVVDPKRAAGKKHHAEHARDSKAFSVCEPDVGDAVHCRTRAQRLPQSPCTQSPRPDHADAKDPDYGCPDLWRDSRRHVDVDRTNDRGTRFSRRTLSECFEKRTDLCLAGARRFDDRCPYCRWRHCDFGGRQRCAERRYRGGFN